MEAAPLEEEEKDAAEDEDGKKLAVELDADAASALLAGGGLLAVEKDELGLRKEGSLSAIVSLGRRGRQPHPPAVSTTTAGVICATWRRRRPTAKCPTPLLRRAALVDIVVASRAHRPEARRGTILS